MKKTPLLIIGIIVLIGGVVFAYRNKIENLFSAPLPLAQPYQPTTQASVKPSQTLPTRTSGSLPAEVNLDVPFTSQAPLQNWDEIHEEFCEEAAVLMAISYVKGWAIPNPNFADQKMFEIKTFEDQRFGYYKDTTTEETAIILREFYKYDKVKLLKDPSVEDIKKSLSEGKVIIVPAAGRQLGNPHFRNPGPLYHMVVIKGYTKNGDFITNDAGTRFGANYIYSPSVIMNAMHDWNGGDVNSGKKVIIVVG